MSKASDANNLPIDAYAEDFTGWDLPNFIRAHTNLFEEQVRDMLLGANVATADDDFLRCALVVAQGLMAERNKWSKKRKTTKLRLACRTLMLHYLVTCADADSRWVGICGQEGATWSEGERGGVNDRGLPRAVLQCSLARDFPEWPALVGVTWEFLQAFVLKDDPKAPYYPRRLYTHQGISDDMIRHCVEKDEVATFDSPNGKLFSFPDMKMQYPYIEKQWPPVKAKKTKKN